MNTGRIAILWLVLVATLFVFDVNPGRATRFVSRWLEAATWSPPPGETELPPSAFSDGDATLQAVRRGMSRRVRPAVPLFPTRDIAWSAFAVFTLVASWRYFGRREPAAASK